MTRNLVEHQITAEQAARIETAMRAAFEEAEVDAAEIERLEPAMANDRKDRHVLAAAVAADSELIVTFDLDDFPPEACEPLGVEATHPDDFLLDLHDLNPDGVRAALEQQAADLNPAWPLDELLRALTSAAVPRFADTIRVQRYSGSPMQHRQELTTHVRSRSQATVADLHRSVRTRRSLGLGFGDRFEDFRGGSGAFKAGMQGAEKPATLQGKRASKPYSDIA
jgi:hypothetical protein